MMFQKKLKRAWKQAIERGIGGVQEDGGTLRALELRLGTDVRQDI
jgi:hypothetical protein